MASVNAGVKTKSSGDITKEENISVSSSLESQEDHKLDAAAKFLDEHKDVDHSHVDITKLRHKVDRNVVSILCLLYILAFLDKAIYNYTALMGIKKDLKFKGNDFSNIASAYAIAHLLMQAPIAYFIQKFPASKWLSFCIFGWGITTFFTAFVTNVTGMLMTRIVLAIFEATISPSLMLITGMWYTKSEQAPRFAIWHSAPGISQILGGLLSFAFQGIKHDGRFWTGWRWMFITLGTITIFIGILTFLWLPDNPMNAKFMKTEEKVAILKHVSINMTGITQHKPRPREILEALKDPQIYMLVLPGIFAALSSGLTGTYSTTLIHNMGFSNRKSALLNMPSGLVGISANLIVGIGIRHTSNRWAWGVGLTVPGILGSSLLSFLRQPNMAGSLVGIYLVVCIYSITTVVQSWAMANVSGHTKRSVMAAAMSACYGIGAIIGPQTFQDRDKHSNYLPAKITVLVSQVVCAMFFIALWQYYLSENKRRDRKHKETMLEDDTGGVQLTTEESWAGLTDKQNQRFRYVY